jgi:hypothetical protein
MPILGNALPGKITFFAARPTSGAYPVSREFSNALWYKILRFLVHLFDELWQAPECGHAAHPGAVFECW